MVTVHGIANCDTVKKARAWLVERGRDYRFRDFKKDPPSKEELGRWADALGWEALLNRRGTTFRGLSDADKADIDGAKALRLMQMQPSLIKRPVIDGPKGLSIGWNSSVQDNLSD